MPTPFDNPAAIACGCNHQQNLSGPLASGDFTNIATNNAADGVYTLNGSPATIGDIIDLDHPDGAFDPVQDIDTDGIKARDTGGGGGMGQGRSLIMQASLSTALLASGYTAVLEVFPDDLSAGFFAISEFSDDWSFDVSSASVDGFTVKQYTESSGSDDWSLDHPERDLPTADAINKVALTITPTYVSASLNGGPAFRVTGTTDFGNFDLVRIDTPINLGARLRSFAFYEVVDDADLPTLSALS